MELLAALGQWIIEKLIWLRDTPEVTWSGAGVAGISVLYALITRLFAPRSRRDPIPPVSNTFTNSGPGEQNLAQGDHAVGKRTDVNQTSTGNGCIIAGTGPVHVVQQINPLPPPPPVPHHPPAPEACFLHREEELVWLDERLHPGRVAAVCGPGGMGKSALAAQAVSRLEPDRFPDGIVLHSFYHQPGTDTALQHLAEAFGIRAESSLALAPGDALASKKALLILDGTEEAEDLPALLRLRGGCGVLITSRKKEDAPDCRLDLAPLGEPQAEDVFRRYRNPGGGDSLPAEEEESVRRICQLLGGWPVGLRIAGRYLGSTGESAAAYLRWLEKRPFRKLGDGQHQEDNAALLLERSVAQVSAEAGQVLRLAGALAFAPISPGPVMAVLAEEEEDPDELELRSIEALGELVRYGLLERQGERWQISHALIHTYARTELALSREGLERVVWYYIACCDELSDAGMKGYARLDEERAHCLRLMETCLASGLWQEVKALAEAIREYLDLQGQWTELLKASEITLTAAQQAGDRENEGICLTNLGYICACHGDLEKASVYYEQSLPIHREIGCRQGECITLNNIGAIYQQDSKYELALECCEQSLSIAREVCDRTMESMTLNNIGLLYRKQGDNETALQYHEHSLHITQDVGDKIGEGITLNDIAIIYRKQGKPAKASEYHKQALAIRRELGDRAGEAESCWNIGATYYSMDDLAQAEEHIRLAVEIAEAIGHPSLEKWRDGLERVRAKRRGARHSPRRKGMSALRDWLRGKRQGK